MQTFILIKNNIIVDYMVAETEADVKKCFNDADVRSVPFALPIGADVRIFDADYNTRPNSILIHEGLLTLDKDKKLVGEIITAKTQLEKYIDGTDTIPVGYKLNTDKTAIEAMTAEEKKSTGIITVEEYNTIKNTQILAQIADIDAQLNTLDLKSIRSRGEIQDGTDTDGKAAAKLAKYKAEIAALREQRKTLTKSIKAA